MSDIRNCANCGGTHFGSDECPVDSTIIEFKRAPTEAEIATDLKSRIEAAMIPVLALFDEANAQGLIVNWDMVGPQPPFGRNKVVGLKIVKHY